MHATTQECENVDLMPTTMNLGSNECLWVYSSVYMQPRLLPGLSKDRHLKLCPKFLRAHQDKVKGCNPADTQCTGCVY